MITISVGKADATTVDKVTLTSGMVKAVIVAFRFSEEWDTFKKIAVFSNGDTTIDVELDEVERCYIPHEMLAVAGREITCGVYGSQGSGDTLVVLPTIRCSLGKVVEGVDPTGDESVTPSNPIIAEIYESVSEIEEDIGNIDAALDRIINMMEEYAPAASLMPDGGEEPIM